VSSQIYVIVSVTKFVLLCYIVSFVWSNVSYDEKTANELLYYVLVLNSYVCDHAASLRISVIATALKYLASGKKSIEQMHPTAPQ